MSISKIKINDKEYNLIASNTAYGTCSTPAATAAKVITTSSAAGWILTPGARITIKFTYTNSASNPTFNVNGTGAKSVWYGTGLLTTSNKGYAGTANRPMDFIYDGTQYVFMGWSYDANTTYTNASLGQGYGTCSTAAATAAKVVTLSSYALTTGGIVAVKFTYDVPAAATMNINSKGAKAIYYQGAAITNNIIKAGDTATFIYNGTYYHLISIDKMVGQKTGDGGEIFNDYNNNRADAPYAHAEGQSTIVNATAAHAEGFNTQADGLYSHAEGAGETRASNAEGTASHSEGWDTWAKGNYSHAEGNYTEASGHASHAEGNSSIASGSSAHAEGQRAEASEESAHAEGTDTTASGAASHAEGYNTTASGDNAHAEGEDTTAEGIGSHAEGFGTIAEGDYSHAEGAETTAMGDYSHVEGIGTITDAAAAHASGYYTEAGYNYQFVCGMYNENKEDTLFEVGNGSDPEQNRYNAFEVYQDGHAEVQFVGDTDNSIVHRQYVNGMIVPKAVQSENDFTDINKKYILSNNLIYQYKNEPKSGMPTFANRVRSAADPTNLNQVLNGVGYKHDIKYGFDWNTGALVEETFKPTGYLPGYAIGVIRVTNNDIVRIKHIGFATNGTVDFITLVRPSDAPGIGCEGLNQNKLSKITTGGGHYTLIGSNETASLQDVEIHINTATFGWVVEDDITEYYLVFYSTITVAPEDLIITVNEEIEFMENTTITGWTPINKYQDSPEYLHRIISNLELRILNLEAALAKLS